MTASHGLPPGLDTVIPLVRTVRGAPSGDSEDAVVGPLAGSLVVWYAFDHNLRVVTHSDLATLGVDQVSLAAAALDNLINRMGDLEILERPDGCGMLRLDGTLEASALLVIPLWRDIAGILSDEVVVAVPTLDAVLFCGAGALSHRRALVAARDRALAVGNHPLTNELLRFDGRGSWQLEEP
jgi:hypothetical protein